MLFALHDRIALLIAIAATVASAGGSAWAITPDNPGPADVRLTINSLANPARPISPYIYGANSALGGPLDAPITLDRLGGNRWTGYNWETNASNAGSDWNHQSDNYLVNGQPNTAPGQAILPSLQAAAASDRALIVTVPIAGYAAADANGTSVSHAQTAPSPRWREVVAKKHSKYPGAPLALSPNKTDNYVFTDELVNWVEQSKQPGQPVFYSLDNEPGLWSETHVRLHPTNPTFAEMRDKTIAHAAAIKDVNPQAIVFGGVGYGWSDFVELQHAADDVTTPVHPGGDEESGELHYYEWLLKETAAAEASQGRTLMDVLDLHWYPEAQGGGVRITTDDSSPAIAAARVQAPRSLWDPTYVETSWISQWGTWSGTPGNPGPVKLLPRVQRDIDDFKPGAKIAITEYNYGGTNHISGGIAQADALGVFGREGVFAANFWQLHTVEPRYVDGAFQMYLNFDGNGGAFGDQSVEAATTSLIDSAVYASLDSDDPSRMVLIAINRTGVAKTAAVEVTHDRRFNSAEVYQLTAASATPQRAADIPIGLVNAFLYTMPAYSVSTIVLRGGVEGDFNGDGSVDGDDLQVWKGGFGKTGATLADGDANGDGLVDGADFLLWQRNAGAAADLEATPIPEPATPLLATGGALVGIACRRSWAATSRSLARPHSVVSCRVALCRELHFGRQAF
jgi:hypothetical protein